MTPEELQQIADEIAQKRIDVMKHVEEIDNPNKATRNVGTVGQNDNVQPVDCRNCGFGMASYETKCVACGCKVKA